MDKEKTLKIKNILNTIKRVLMFILLLILCNCIFRLFFYLAVPSLSSDSVSVISGAITGIVFGVIAGLL